MLRTFINAIPDIIGAVVILAVFYFVGRYVTELLGQLLANLDVDKLPARLGISNILGTNRLSSILSNVAFSHHVLWCCHSSRDIRFLANLCFVEQYARTSG